MLPVLGTSALSLSAKWHSSELLKETIVPGGENEQTLPCTTQMPPRQTPDFQRSQGDKVVRY